MEEPLVVTRSQLVSQLRTGGVRVGDVLCVHTSLQRLGLVIGGARAIVEALIEAVTSAGTIMMPCFSGDLSDPAEWRHPPVPASDWDRIREETPAFDWKLTPSRRLGATPEYFRHYPGVIRSPHPQSSFCAWGKHAAELVGEHPLSYRFGPNSPLGKFAALGGRVLMLGAPLNTSSFYYLGFYPAEDSSRIQKRAPMLIGGRKKWVEYEDLPYHNKWFVGCTEKLLQQGMATRFPTGASESVLINAGDALPQIRECCLAAGTL